MNNDVYDDLPSQNTYNSVLDIYYKIMKLAYNYFVGVKQL